MQLQGQLSIHAGVRSSALLALLDASQRTCDGIVINCDGGRAEGVVGTDVQALELLAQGVRIRALIGLHACTAGLTRVASLLGCGTSSAGMERKAGKKCGRSQASGQPGRSAAGLGERQGSAGVHNENDQTMIDCLQH